MFFTVPAACRNLRQAGGGDGGTGQAAGKGEQPCQLSMQRSGDGNRPCDTLQNKQHRYKQHRCSCTQPASQAHSSVFLVLLRCRASGEMQPSSSVLQELATSLLPPPRAAGVQSWAGAERRTLANAAEAGRRRLACSPLLNPAGLAQQPNAKQSVGTRQSAAQRTWAQHLGEYGVARHAETPTPSASAPTWAQHLGEHGVAVGQGGPLLSQLLDHHAQVQQAHVDARALGPVELRQLLVKIDCRQPRQERAGPTTNTKLQKLTNKSPASGRRCPQRPAPRARCPQGPPASGGPGRNGFNAV